MFYKVSIIVPVYKDWDTLSICIESLKKYVSKEHKVILANDNSNEADIIEKNILNSIKGCDNFFYFRNEKNIGFVKTCNKYVFHELTEETDILLLNSDTEVTEGFLEEMLDVLYLSDKHGVVCPRSNNATILSVPINTTFERSEIIYKSYQCYKEIKEYLPRFSVIPTGVGFCILIKRQIIDNFGLFDEIYGHGYNEENDFIMRINKYGYSTVMANKAFVFHFESKSFGKDKREKLNHQNEKILLTRYPHFKKAVEEYFERDINPVDYFADLIASNFYPKKKILICLYNLPNMYNGTAEYQLNLLENFYALCKDKYEITILTNRPGNDFFRLSDKYKNVVFPDSIEGRFHLAFVPSQIFNFDILKLLNNLALKIVFTMQDIIALRCLYLESKDNLMKKAFEYSIIYSDGIITISDFVKNDIFNYFNSLEQSTGFSKIKTIYHGLSENNYSDNSNHYKLPFKDYILIVGNQFYHHKMINEVIKNINNQVNDINFIVIGAENSTQINGNIAFYKSGSLSDDFVTALYKNCSAILFPSHYEGFGLPILKALEFEKIILLVENDLNKELKKNILNGKSINNIIFFKDFHDLINKLNDIKNIIKNTQPNITIKDKLRTWKDVAIDTSNFIEEILNSEVNYTLLQKRWSDIKLLEYFKESNNHNEFELIKKLNLINSLALTSTALYKLNKTDEVNKIFKLMSHEIATNNILPNVNIFSSILNKLNIDDNSRKEVLKYFRNEFLNPQIIFSIVVPVYNQLEYTKKFIESLANISFEFHTRFELIIINNASNIDTEEYLNRLLKTFKKLKVINNSINKGFPKAINQGITVAEGKYILIANNDIIITKNSIERMINVLEMNSSIGIVGPVSNIVSGLQKDENAKYNSIEEMHKYAAQVRGKNKSQVLHFPRVAFLCTLIKREVIEKIGGLDERFSPGNYEDDDFCLRAQLAGYKTVIAKDVFIHHFGSKSFKANGEKAYQDRLMKNQKIFVDKWGATPDEIWLKNKQIKPHQIFYPIDKNLFQQHFRRVRVHLADNELELAQIEIEKAIEHFQEGDASVISKVDLLDLAGNLFLTNNNIEKAQYYFEQELQLSPNSSNACLGLGKVLLANNQPEAAKVMFEWAVKNDPDNPNALAALNELNSMFGVEAEKPTLGVTQ